MTPELTMSSDALDLTLEVPSGLLTVVDKRNGVAWRQVKPEKSQSKSATMVDRAVPQKAPSSSRMVRIVVVTVIRVMMMRHMQSPARVSEREDNGVPTAGFFSTYASRGSKSTV